MAKNIQITIQGETYPCRVTMGAFVRFKRETGKDVSEMKGNMTELCTLMYCYVASACKADGVEFNMDFETFADSVNVEDFKNFIQEMSADEKKTQP